MMNFEINPNIQRKLHASQLGTNCMRRLFFRSIGMKEKVSDKAIRRMDVGNAIEPVAVEWLKRDGYEVWYGDSERGRDFELHVGDGVITGRIDILLVQGLRGVVYDIKTVDLQNAYKLRKETVEELMQSHKDYIIQINLYVYALLREDINKLTAGRVEDICDRECGLVVVSREMCDYGLREFEYNESVIREALEKAKKVFSVKNVEDFIELPIDERECKWCGFTDICNK